MSKSRLWMTTALTVVGASFALLPANGAAAQDSSQALIGQPAPQSIARPSGGAGASTEAPPAARTAVAGAEDASGMVSELVVTARKREERLIDVPISIQAFSAAEIKASNIESIVDLQFRAGFTVLQQVSTGAGGRTQGNLVCRGLQGLAFTSAVQNSCSLFIDGIFISGAPQSVITPDVERIEVLKGPQNAYFGRSTFGGAINFITRTPTDTPQGEINVRATARGSVDGDASFEGPILPGILDGRLTIFDHNKVAEYRASDGGDLGAEQSRGLTGTLYFKPMPNLWFRVRGTYQEDNDSSADQAFLTASKNDAAINGNAFAVAQADATGACTGKNFHGQDASGNPVTFQLGRPFFCNGVPTIAQLGTGIIDASTVLPANIIGPLEHNSLGLRFLNSTPRLNHTGLVRDIIRGSFQGGYKFDGGATLDFNVGYNNAKSTYAFDIDHTFLNYFINAFANLDEDLTADVRLASNQSSRLRGLVGASYSTTRNATDRIDDDIIYGNFLTQSIFQDNRSVTPSVYGSLEFDVLSYLTVTAEGRYESEEDTSYDLAYHKYKQTFTSFLPRVIIKYHPNANLDAYVSYSEGAQPTELNASFVAASPTARAYLTAAAPGQSEFSVQPKLRSYEIGLKQRLFEGRVEYSLTAYQMWWDHEITVNYVQNPISCFPTGAAPIQNTPACPLASFGSSLLYPNDARLRGIEFDGTVHVTHDFDLSATVDYKNPIWTKFFDNAEANLTSGVGYFKGNTLGQVPNVQATISGTYHHRLSDEWNFYARGDGLYTGKAWDSNFDIVQANDFWRVNARIGVERNDLTFEFFATNLLNDKNWDNVNRLVSVTSGFDYTQQGVLVQAPDRPEFGLRVQYKYR